MRNLLTGAWLNGLLSQADPKQYPKLETLLEGEQKPERPDPKQAASNARAWAAWLTAANKKG